MTQSSRWIETDAETSPQGIIEPEMQSAKQSYKLHVDVVAAIRNHPPDICRGL